MKNLVIVEASGKIDVLQRALKAIHLPAEVLATVGHIAGNPRTLSDIALDQSLRETRYEFREDRMALLGKIQRAAASADRIYLAMDDDQEGDVIAHDLAWVLDDNRDKLVRVRLRALSENELQQAFSGELGQDFQTPASNGICRRIVDRAIGATFSRVSESEFIPVGRVQSSLLATLAEELPEIGRYVLQLPDGLTAELPVHSMDEVLRYEALAKQIESGAGLAGARLVSDQVVTVPAATPWGYEEIVEQASERLGLGIEAASDALQEAYLRGKVSYPRVSQNGFTEDAVEVAARLARQNRTQFDGSLLPRRGAGLAGMAHESPRPMDDELPLGRSFAVMDSPDAIAALVARNMIECGQVQKRREVVVEYDGMRMEFGMPQSRTMRSWKNPVPQLGFTRYAPDRAILRYMHRHDLGRPSTMVHHVTKFLQRDVLRADGQDLGLNSRGKQWLAAAVAVGFTKSTSAEMERAFSEPMKNPNDAALAVLRNAGMLEPVRNAIRLQASATAVQDFEVRM